MTIARAILAAALMALGLTAALAQTTSGSIAGTVRSETGQPNPDAVIEARSEESGVVRTAVCEPDGSYRIDLLAPGRWTVAARIGNGQRSEPRTVVIGLEQVLTLDFVVGSGLEERLTVTARPPLLDPKETGGKLRVSSDQAGALPLAGRIFTDLAQLDSSVRQAAPGNYYGERGSVFVVNGQSGRSNTFLVDGLDNNDDTSGTNLNSFFSQQVIREFVLSTHQYSPEFGRASGGVLNIVTRRGGNETNWEVFAQGSANGWNSSGDFVDRLPDRGLSQDAVRRSQAGFRLGGPIKRDKAFYFVAYERQQADDVIPYTGIDRERIAGGRIRAPAEDDSLFLRTDFNFGSKTNLMLRLSGDDRSSRGVNVGGTTTPEAGFRIDEQDLQFAAALTRVVSPTLLSETRFLAATSSFDQRANSDRPGVARPSGIFGSNNLSEQLRDEDKFQLVHNVTWIRDAHTFKFGVDLTRSRTDVRTTFSPNGNFIYNSDRPFEPGDCGIGAGFLQAQNTLEDGTVLDSQGNPLCTGIPGVDDDGDGLIDEPTNILSYPLVFQYIDGRPQALLEDTRLGLFAQDNWTVNDRLTLDYGLRYDLSTYELPRSAAVDSTIPNGGASRDTDNIAPRVGFALTSRSGKLVLRGGGGLFYDKLVLGFPAVAAITSGTEIGIIPTQGLAFELTEETVEELGIENILPALFFPEQLILRFSTATELETPYTVQFNLGVDRSLGKGVVKANLTRAQGYRQPLMKDLNPVGGLARDLDCAIDPNLEVGIPCHAFDPNVGSIAAITTEGRNWFWSLDLGWRWRGATSWFSSSYTLSRAEDMGFDPLKGGIALPPDSTDLSLERGRSDGDRRHRLVLSGDVPLPLWGVRASGVLQLASGLPFNVTTGQDDNVDGILSDRPEGVRRNSGEDTSLRVINDLRAEHNKTLPPDQQLGPIGSLNEPSFAQIDVRLYKSFQLSTERGYGEFFFQVFNILDRENGGLIEGRAVSRSFGEVITLAGPPRTIELGIKVGY